MALLSTALSAAACSGAPSTAIALARGDDPLTSTRAIGRVVVGDDAAPTRQLVAGAAGHVLVSSFWTAVLWRVLPRRRTLLAGAGAGVAIAALDLGLIARRIPALRRLPLGPQLADHLAFGLIVAWGRHRSR